MGLSTATTFLIPIVLLSFTIISAFPFSIERNYDLGSVRFSSSLNAGQLSSLPDGISVYEKSDSKYMDIQADFRARAKTALDKAIADGVTLCEFEFPPLIGGDQSKTQFDDFDNIQELDKNKDWSVLFAASLMSNKAYDDGKMWLVFPDIKECEIAKKEWAGKRYRAAKFTTIEAVTNYFQGEGSYDAPWGANLINGLSKVMGGENGDAGLLGDKDSLDELESSPELAIVVQPGNGGPVCQRQTSVSKLFLSLHIIKISYFY